MKKQIVLLTAAVAVGFGSLKAQSLDDLSVTSTFAWESEYVFRGVKFAQNAFQPGLDIELGDLYVGTWGSFATNDSYADGNEINFFGGYGIALDDVFSLDLGVTVYYFPPSDDNTTEIYAGIAADTVASPSAYIFYDFDLEALTIEGSIGHSIPLDQSLSLDLGAFAGFVTPDEGDDYFYYGLTADVSLEVNATSSASVGVRFAGNDIDDADLSEFLWWGFSFSTGF